jgi:hypothetical protein
MLQSILRDEHPASGMLAPPGQLLSPVHAPASDGRCFGRIPGRYGGHCLLGEAILQASVAELVDRPDSAQDVAFSGVFEEPQEAERSVPARGELRKGKWPRR